MLDLTLTLDKAMPVLRYKTRTFKRRYLLRCGVCLQGMSHPLLRPNRLLIVCMPRNQVYTHTVQKMDTE
jgi:hypothetical protein